MPPLHRNHHVAEIDSVMYTSLQLIDIIRFGCKQAQVWPVCQKRPNILSLAFELQTNQHYFPVLNYTSVYYDRFSDVLLLYCILGISFSQVCIAEYLIETKRVVPMRNHYQHFYRLVNDIFLFSLKQVSTECYNNEAVKVLNT